MPCFPLLQPVESLTPDKGSRSSVGRPALTEKSRTNRCWLSWGGGSV
jgi:hypothetical protein